MEPIPHPSCWVQQEYLNFLHHLTCFHPVGIFLAVFWNSRKHYLPDTSNDEHTTIFPFQVNLKTDLQTIRLVQIGAIKFIDAIGETFALPLIGIRCFLTLLERRSIWFAYGLLTIVSFVDFFIQSNKKQRAEHSHCSALWMRFLYNPSLC